MRTPRTIALLGALLATPLLPAAAHALTACTAAQIISQDSNCPNNTNPCSITKFFTISNGCTLDFGTRAVTLTASGTLDIGANTVTLKAGSFTAGPGSLVDGRGNSAAPRNRGGMFTIQTTGNVTTQKSGTSVGRVLFSGDVAGGTVRIEAGGTVTIADKLTADSSTTTGAGGSIIITAGGDIVTLNASLLSAKGGDAGSGNVDLTARGRIDLGDIVDITGKEGGILSVVSGGEAIVRKVLGSATGDAGSGGCIDITGGTRVQLLDQILLKATTSGDGTFGGCGGELDAEALFGDLTVATGLTLDASGAAPDGFGGAITLAATGVVTLPAGATLDAGASGAQGCGGEITIDSNYLMTLAGTLAVSGGLMGGSVDLTSQSGVSLSGTLNATGRSDGSLGGIITGEAGFQGTGNFSVPGKIDATGVGCDTFGFCGQGGAVDLFGCDVTIPSTGQVLTGGPSGGSNSITAREQVNVAGVLNAAKTNAAGVEGVNVVRHPTRKPPILGAGVNPPASVTGLPTCIGPNLPPGCIDPCPTCGNGLIEWPETCDNSIGTPQSCDGCSAFCRLEVCNDTNVCTTDSCDPRLGCNYVPVTNGTSCSDGRVCNGVESCSQGACIASNVPNCADANPCTLDQCVEPTGCTHPPATGSACTDNNACTVGDVCNASGTCSAGSPRVCNDGLDCTTDTCNTATGCVFTPRTGTCTDDGNPCTSDTCSGTTCTHPARANGSSCSDGLFCTVGEACQSGVCTGGTANCLDTNPCTNDSCSEATGCSNTPAIGAPCNDNNACTVSDTCNASAVCTGSPRVCDDLLECTTDTCNTTTGCVFTPRTGTCTDDGNACTNDVCSGTACTHPARANGTTCNDGFFCTINDTCQNGTCTGGGPNCVDTNDCTVDTCSETSGCANDPATGASCSDGDPCTSPDICDASGTCRPGPVICTTSTTTTLPTTTTTTLSTTTTSSTTTTTTTSSTTTTTVPAPIGHLKCYKAKDVRAKATYTLDLLAGVAGFPNELGCTVKLGSKKICVEVTKQNVVPAPPGGGPGIGPNAGAVFLSYKLKCPKQSVPPIALRDQFGAGVFTVGTANELLVPALPGPPKDHLKCYKAKDSRPKASYTMNLLAGVAGFSNETGCGMKLGAKKVCVKVTKQNVTPTPPGGGPAPGPNSTAKLISYKLKCPKGSVPPIAVSDQFGAGTVAPGTVADLLVPAGP